ncbi:hypothetical protein F5883DRAFT_549276 [Diaporthe sp. PMI_573]|nr:hypothetical protein F5883DRAFT_549276 [Diaporthaceae sp. PMI_573]
MDSRLPDCPAKITSSVLVLLLRCGPVWPLCLFSLRFGSIINARGFLNNLHIRLSRRGRGDEDHPSFITQALHPQLKQQPTRCPTSQPSFRPVCVALCSHN